MKNGSNHDTTNDSAFRRSMEAHLRHLARAREATKNVAETHSVKAERNNRGFAAFFAILGAH